MALADWTPERMARFERDLATQAKVNAVVKMYAATIVHQNGVDVKRRHVENMHSARRFGKVTQGWDGQEVPEYVRARQFMQEWYQREGMPW